MSPACETGELLLAADTSTRHCAVGVCRIAGNDLCEMLAQSCVDSHRLHAEGLLDAMDRLLDALGLDLKEIHALAISSGPGSFTGLRIGAATWKGLAFALGLPLIAVPTLDAMTRLNATVDGIVVPMLDARMGEVFGSVYRFRSGVREKLCEDRVCSVEALMGETPPDGERVLVLGDGAQRYRDRIRECAPNALFAPAASGVPRADAVAMEATALLRAGCEQNPALVAPRYLRASQAEQAREARLMSEGSTTGARTP